MPLTANNTCIVILLMIHNILFSLWVILCNFRIMKKKMKINIWPTLYIWKENFDREAYKSRKYFVIYSNLPDKKTRENNLIKLAYISVEEFWNKIIIRIKYFYRYNFILKGINEQEFNIDRPTSAKLTEINFYEKSTKNQLG